jgi:Uma2 family endonuclease
MAIELVRHRFTVADFHRMAEAGILGGDDRVELIDGEIVEMTPIGSRHAACVDRLAQLFFEQVGRRAIVRVQSPIRLGEHSEPQPDVTLLRPHPDFYAASHPRPEDVLLVVEVAETSAQLDRAVKAPLYARAGIPELWLVDLEAEAIVVHRLASSEGYRDVRTARRGQRLSAGTPLELDVAADAVLGERPA